MKLVTPVVKDEMENARQAAESKVAMLEAFITRKVKANKIVSIHELEQEAQDELGSTVHISTNEFRSAIESLVARNFIEHTTKNRLRYVA
jgi:hypothetical protein